MPFLVGAYVWLQWGPTKAKHTPKAVARGVAKAIAITFTPRRAAHTPADGDRWFMDAAQYKSFYVVGLWGANVGYRLWQAPAWVRSQQVAELYGLQEAIKLAEYRKCRDIEIVGDNLATVKQVVHQCARAPLRC